MRIVGIVLMLCGGCGGDDDDDDAVGPGEDAGSVDAPPGRDGSNDETCLECIELTGALVFDGTATRAGTVILRGDTIDRVVYGGDAPVIGATTIDMTGATILPGLMDLHTHSFVSPGPRGWGPAADLSGVQIKTSLRAGVTTALDVGSPWGRIFELRDLIANDQLPGPRLLVAGPMITSPGGHPCLGSGDDPCIEVGSAAEVPGAMADLIADGPDVIKVIQEQGWKAALPLHAADTLAAIVGEAGALPVLAHISRSTDAADMLDAGVHILAHTPFQDALSGDVVARLAADGDTVIPTLAVADAAYRISHGTFDEIGDPALADDVHASVIEALGNPDDLALMMDPTFQAHAQTSIDNATASLQALHAAGVRIAAGTDAGNAGVFHGLSIRRELALYVEAGFTPAEAILTATRNAADVIGRADLGRIEEGAIADLLIVEGDPLADIGALGAVRAVYKEGVEVDRDALRIFH